MEPSIIITGANGNLGSALLKKSLEKGFRVHAVISPRKDKSFYLHEKIKVRQADLTDKEACKKLVDEMTHDDPNIGLAIFTAGGFAMGKLDKLSTIDFIRMMDLNFYTALNMVLPLYQYLIKEKKTGHLVFIGAKPAMDMAAASSMAPYALSKSLLLRMAELINQDAASTGIRASVLVPTVIDTPQNREAMPEADFSQWMKPEEIADAIFHHHLEGKYPEGADIIPLGEQND